MNDFFPFIHQITRKKTKEELLPLYIELIPIQQEEPPIKEEKETIIIIDL